eukprot:gene15819-21938_t
MLIFGPGMSLSSGGTRDLESLHTERIAAEPGSIDTHLLIGTLSGTSQGLKREGSCTSLASEGYPRNSSVIQSIFASNSLPATACVVTGRVVHTRTVTSVLRSCPSRILGGKHATCFLALLVGSGEGLGRSGGSGAYDPSADDPDVRVRLTCRPTPALVPLARMGSSRSPQQTQKRQVEARFQTTPTIANSPLCQDCVSDCQEVEEDGEVVIVRDDLEAMLSALPANIRDPLSSHPKRSELLEHHSPQVRSTLLSQPTSGIPSPPIPSDHNYSSALSPALPGNIKDSLSSHPKRSELLEVVLDLGRRPEARFLGIPGGEYLRDEEITAEDLKVAAEIVGEFGQDNRAGITGTLHRISAIR